MIPIWKLKLRQGRIFDEMGNRKRHSSKLEQILVATPNTVGEIQPKYFSRDSNLQHIQSCYLLGGDMIICTVTSLLSGTFEI